MDNMKILPVFGGLCIALAILSACGSSGSNADTPVTQIPSTVMAIDVGGKPVRCVARSETNFSSYGRQLTGEFRNRMLTPEAQASDIRVWVSGVDVTQYGNVVVAYTDSKNTCVVWSESLTLQEYAVRLGLNPVGISPHYQAENK